MTTDPDPTPGWLASALMAVAAVVILLLCGCAPRLTVVAADRIMVPVRQTDERTYVRDESPDCTGWYVPTAVMMDITDRLNED